MVKRSNGRIICVHNHRHHHEERNRQPFHDHMKSLPWGVVCLSHLSHIIESFAFCQVYVYDLSNQICRSWEVYQQIIAEPSGYQGSVMVVYFFHQYRLCLWRSPALLLTNGQNVLLQRLPVSDRPFWQQVCRYVWSR